MARCPDGGSRSDRAPRWMDQAFWATEIDPILLSGLRNASQCQSEAVETVMHAFPQLHVGMIWDRLRRLRKQRTAALQAVVTALVVANGGRPDLARGNSNREPIGARNS